MPPIRFKLEYTVRDLIMPRSDTYSLEYGGPHSTIVLLRAPTAEEQAIGHKSTDAFCTASSQVTPSDVNFEMFGRIAENKVLGDRESFSTGTDYVGPTGTRIQTPALSGFPQHFQSFVRGARQELFDYVRRTVSVLRWRTNELGPHNPFSSRGTFWSFDGEFWHPTPGEFGFNVELQHEISATAQVREEIRGLVVAGAVGPLHHDLYREAWGQRRSNPRSALVIGIAAAELAMKSCIAALVPDAGWLAANLPTPPLVKMLTEYLPLLPAVCRIHGAVKPPPKDVVEDLKKGVNIRNIVSHAGAGGPTSDAVERLLKAIRDVLWLLDYYSGNEWALQFVREETRNALGC